MSPKMMITVDVLGRRMRVPFSGTPEQYAELIAGQRYRAAEKRRLLKRARRATGEKKIKAVGDYVSLLGSHERIAALLPLIEHEPAEVFWPVFLEWWPMCDCAWDWNAWLVKILRRVGPCRDLDYMYADGGEFFCDLPGTITVYRGASRSRIKGAISWTTDIAVARNFARGHRGIAVPDPVVAIGVIDKSKIFLATDDRRESEILAPPRITKIADVVKESSHDTAAMEGEENV
jgi:hypothetical protein